MDFEVAEDPADFGLVIERQKKAALEVFEQSRKIDIVLFGEVELVVRQAEVRRIEVKESVRPVVASDDVLISPALKLDSKQPFVGHVQEHRNSVRVVI